MHHVILKRLDCIEITKGSAPDQTQIRARTNHTSANKEDPFGPYTFYPPPSSRQSHGISGANYNYSEWLQVWVFEIDIIGETEIGHIEIRDPGPKGSQSHTFKGGSDGGVYILHYDVL